jgi:hypothetical protein
MVKYCGAVLRSGIISLPAILRRVMDGEEDGDELIVRDNRRIEDNPHGMHMAGRPALDLFIRRTCDCSARVPRNGFHNAIDVPECSLHIPEAAGSKGGFLVVAAGIVHILPGWVRQEMKRAG